MAQYRGEIDSRESSSNWVGPTIGLGLTAAGLWYTTRHWKKLGGVVSTEGAAQFHSNVSKLPEAAPPPIVPGTAIKPMKVEIGHLLTKSSKEIEVHKPPAGMVEIASVPKGIGGNPPRELIFSSRSPEIRSLFEELEAGETAFHTARRAKYASLAEKTGRPLSEIIGVLDPRMVSQYTAGTPAARSVPTGTKSMFEFLREAERRVGKAGGELKLSVGGDLTDIRLNVFKRGATEPLPGAQVQLPIPRGSYLQFPGRREAFGGVFKQGILGDFYQGLLGKFKGIAGEFERARGKKAMSIFRVNEILGRAANEMQAISRETYGKAFTSSYFNDIRGAHQVYVPELQTAISKIRNKMSPSELGSYIHGFLEKRMTQKGQLFEGVSAFELMSMTTDERLMKGIINMPGMAFSRLYPSRAGGPERETTTAFLKTIGIDIRRMGKTMETMGVTPGVSRLMAPGGQFNILQAAMKERGYAPSFMSDIMMIAGPKAEFALGLGPAGFGEGAIMASREFKEGMRKGVSRTLKVPIGKGVHIDPELQQLLEKQTGEISVERGKPLFARPGEKPVLASRQMKISGKNVRLSREGGEVVAATFETAIDESVRNITMGGQQKLAIMSGKGFESQAFAEVLGEGFRPHFVISGTSAKLWTKNESLFEHLMEKAQTLPRDQQGKAMKLIKSGYMKGSADAYIDTVKKISQLTGKKVEEFGVGTITKETAPAFAAALGRPGLKIDTDALIGATYAKGRAQVSFSHAMLSEMAKGVIAPPTYFQEQVKKAQFAEDILASRKAEVERFAELRLKSSRIADRLESYEKYKVHAMEPGEYASLREEFKNINKKLTRKTPSIMRGAEEAKKARDILAVTGTVEEATRVLGQERARAVLEPLGMTFQEQILMRSWPTSDPAAWNNAVTELFYGEQGFMSQAVRRKAEQAKVFFKQLAVPMEFAGVTEDRLISHTAAGVADNLAIEARRAIDELGKENFRFRGSAAEAFERGLVFDLPESINVNIAELKRRDQLTNLFRVAEADEALQIREASMKKFYMPGLETFEMLGPGTEHMQLARYQLKATEALAAYTAAATPSTRAAAETAVSEFYMRMGEIAGKEGYLPRMLGMKMSAQRTGFLRAVPMAAHQELFDLLETTLGAEEKRRFRAASVTEKLARAHETFATTMFIGPKEAKRLDVYDRIKSKGLQASEHALGTRYPAVIGTSISPYKVQVLEHLREGQVMIPASKSLVTLGDNDADMHKIVMLEKSQIEHPLVKDIWEKQLGIHEAEMRKLTRQWLEPIRGAAAAGATMSAPEIVRQLYKETSGVPVTTGVDVLKDDAKLGHILGAKVGRAMETGKVTLAMNKLETLMVASEIGAFKSLSADEAMRRAKLIRGNIHLMGAAIESRIAHQKKALSLEAMKSGEKFADAVLDLIDPKPKRALVGAKQLSELMRDIYVDIPEKMEIGEIGIESALKTTRGELVALAKADPVAGARKFEESAEMIVKNAELIRSKIGDKQLTTLLETVGTYRRDPGISGRLARLMAGLELGAGPAAWEAIMEPGKQLTDIGKAAEFERAKRIFSKITGMVDPTQFDIPVMEGVKGSAAAEVGAKSSVFRKGMRFIQKAPGIALGAGIVGAMFVGHRLAQGASPLGGPPNPPDVQLPEGQPGSTMERPAYVTRQTGFQTPRTQEDFRYHFSGSSIDPRTLESDIQLPTSNTRFQISDRSLSDRNYIHGYESAAVGRF